MEQPTHIVVIGTSAGGLRALSELVRHLDPGMDASFFIVMHLSRTSISNFLINKLQPLTSLRCIRPVDNMVIERGAIYIAPPNHHLIVKNNKILLGNGPTENRWKPSIDVLFRSAAASFGTRVTGMVLSGLLDDGTAGMQAIKNSGGTTIIQDPEEAEYPDMPLSVLNSMEVNYCKPLLGIREALLEIFQTQPSLRPVPPEILLEAEIAEKVVISYENVQAIGEQSIYACPDCGGGLFELTDTDQSRYRCHIGHSYSEKDLAIKQSETLEGTLWIALRIMEEKKNLLKKMEMDNIKRGFSRTALDFKLKVADIQLHINNLREILFAYQTAEAV